MKYVVICQSEWGHEYIAALCDSEKMATEYANKITDPNITTEVGMINSDTYPVHFIEEAKGGFTFLSNEAQVQERIKKIKKIKNFDDCYFTHYTIVNEYFAHPVGTDQMGELDHIHIDNSYIT